MQPPARRPPHVVTLIDYPAAVGGGAEALAFALTLGLDRERFERTLCVLRWDSLTRVDPAKLRDAAAQLERAGVRLLALERRSRWDLAAWRPLVRLLRSGEVEILHSHKFGPNVWGSLLALLTRVPVLVCHEHTWSYEGQPLRRALDRHLISRVSDAFVAVSREDRRRMIAVEHIRPRRIEVVPNGIPTRADARGDERRRRPALQAELGLPDGAPVVGTVAVLRPQKALEMLLAAAVALRERHPELRVVVVGTGPERDRLEALAQELGVAPCVLFAGFRPDVDALLETFDVAVSCSRFEGTPLAILEYMAAGLPIVATRVGGVPDVIADGVHGLLVDPDDPAALADAIDRLLADRQLARRLGDRARDRQRSELTIDATVGHVSGLYERLLTRRGRGWRTGELGGGPESAREAWQELAAAAISPFATYEWGAAWWRAFGAGRRLRLLGCRRRDGSLAALLPLSETRHGPLRVLRFVGHGPADELGPVCAPDDRPAALAALRRAMADRKLRADLVLAERLADAEGVEQAFGGAVLHRESSPALRTAGLTWEELLAGRSRNFREQVRRRERALLRDHAASFRLADDPARLQDDLTTLFALHERRWGADGSGAFDGARADLHRAFAAAALERGWLRLWLLEVEGVAVAAWYGLRHANREWYYQSGRDPAWDGSSVGFVLLAHTIRAAMADGIEEYRMLRGAEPYKQRFADRDRPVHTSAAAGSLRGALVLGAVRLAGVQRPLVRSALKRATG